MLWPLIGLSFEIFYLGPSWMMNYFVWKSCWFGHQSNLKTRCILSACQQIEDWSCQMLCLLINHPCVCFAPFPTFLKPILWMGIFPSFLHNLISDLSDITPVISYSLTFKVYVRYKDLDIQARYQIQTWIRISN